MAIVYMLVGIPGSGKSTFANSLSAIENISIVSSDEVRNLHPSWDESKTFPEVYRLIAEELKNNKNVIFDATNITPSVRGRLKEELSIYNLSYQVGVYYFPVDWKECYRRVKIRNTLPNQRYLPLDILENYGKNIIPPTLEEGFIFIKEIK